MARNNHIINSFVNGEVSPKFSGRQNLQQYNESCEKLYNAIAAPQGGGGKRPGTLYRRTITTTADAVPANGVCIPFSGADGTKWRLVLISAAPEVPGSYTPGVTRTNWFAINTSTKAIEYIEYNPTYHTGTGSAFTNYYANLLSDPYDLQYAQTGDVMTFTSPSYRPFRIIYDNTTTPKFKMKTWAPFENVSDTNAWRMMPFEPPVVSLTASCLILDLNGGGGADTLAPGVGSSVTFSASWKGRYIKFTNNTAGEALVVLVISVTSSILANVVRVGGTMTGTSATTYGSALDADKFYEIGYWDEIKGWPRSVTFFEQRVVFGGSATYPDKGWASEVNDIYELDTERLITDSNYGDPVTDSDPFSFTLKADVLSKIQWLSPGKTIAAGTVGREHVIKGPDETASFGPTNVQTQAETAQGSARAMAARIENAVIFMQKDRRSLRELVFNFAEDSFKAEDLNVLSEHMGRKYKNNFNSNVAPSFSMLTRQNDIIWVVNNCGQLCGLTRNREQQVAAWHHHELAGYGPQSGGVTFEPEVIYASGGAANGVSGVATVIEGGPDDLWMIVRRGTPSGTRYLTLEQMAQPWDKDVIWTDSDDDFDGLWWFSSSEPDRAPVYLDCAVLATAAARFSAGDDPGVVSDLPYGDGAMVSVVVDGEYLGEFEVDNDEIDFSASISDKLNADQDDDEWHAIIGFNYTAKIVPMPPSVPAIIGSSAGQLQRVHEVEVHFLNTIGAQIGLMPDAEEENTPMHNPEEVTFEQGDNQNEPYPMFNGFKKMTMPGGYNKKPRILVQSDKPFPMHVTHIVAKMVVSE